mgnify:CR=1 FL=1
MNRTPLADYLATHKQRELAAAVGLTQAAISLMLAKQRSIFVIEHADGKVELEEVKPIGRSTANA